MELAGAGGKWKTINELKDTTVIQQENDVSCGAACGKMVFKQKGIDVEQEQIRANSGSPTWSEQLAYAMNQLSSSENGEWKGGYLKLPEQPLYKFFCLYAVQALGLQNLESHLKKWDTL